MEAVKQERHRTAIENVSDKNWLDGFDENGKNPGMKGLTKNNTKRMPKVLIQHPTTDGLSIRNSN